MKKQVIALLMIFMLLLSGCSLFPLRADEQLSVLQESEAESEVGEQQTKGDSEDKLIAPAEVDEAAKEEEEGDFMYCISPVNIRDAGSSNSSIIDSLRTGDKVRVLSQDGGWIEIVHEGTSGFVHEQFLGNTAP